MMRKERLMSSLYIHIPFCQSKCPFCSFTVSIGKQNYIDRYLECLKKEAAVYRGTELKTVYIGGGTPSFLSLGQLEYLFNIIKENFSFKKDSECTLESNPEDIDIEKSKALLSMGVNRISLGVQSLNDKYLKFLGRVHDSQKAIKAYHDLRKVGFSNISLDLMFSFPKQSLEELKEDVSQIASLDSEHLSLYALTIEEGTAFSKEQIKLEEDSIQAEQYLCVMEILEKNGFDQYEISNFAKKGKESKHNSMYWQGGDYIGLGIGAHSHKQGHRFWNIRNLTAYISKIKNNQSPVEGEEHLNPGEQLVETMLFGLRMTKGVSLEKLEQRFGCQLSNEKKFRIGQFVKAGFLSLSEGNLKTTLKGKLILDELCAQLI